MTTNYIEEDWRGGGRERERGGVGERREGDGVKISTEPHYQVLLNRPLLRNYVNSLLIFKFYYSIYLNLVT